MSSTHGELIFLVAVVLAVVVPVTISVRAALRPEPVVVPVIRWPEVRRTRRAPDRGYTWGVGLGAPDEFLRSGPLGHGARIVRGAVRHRLVFIPIASLLGV